MGCNVKLLFWRQILCHCSQPYTYTIHFELPYLVSFPGKHLDFYFTSNSTSVRQVDSMSTRGAEMKVFLTDVILMSNRRHHFITLVNLMSFRRHIDGSQSRLLQSMSLLCHIDDYSMSLGDVRSSRLIQRWPEVLKLKFFWRRSHDRRHFDG